MRKAPPPPPEEASVNARSASPTPKGLAIGRRVIALREEKGWSQTELAREAGLNPKNGQQNISSIERGLVESPRHALKIAKALGISIDELLDGAKRDPRAIAVTEASDRSHVRRQDRIPIRGTASAGPWYPPEYFDEVDTVERVNHPEFGHMEQYALRVSGQSMNRVIQDGALAICVPYYKARPIERSGDIVHVVISRGGLEEWSLKRLKITEKAIELWPESTNPKYQEPYRFDRKKKGNDEGMTLRIEGLVFTGVQNYC